MGQHWLGREAVQREGPCGPDFAHLNDKGLGFKLFVMSLFILKSFSSEMQKLKLAVGNNLQPTPSVF